MTRNGNQKLKSEVIIELKMTFLNPLLSGNESSNPGIDLKIDMSIKTGELKQK
ncbi:hypothetical protein [Methanosarcina sp.]|uniref:hypothetical protein n=1 Tax=Methanosarcina sp. TaxID=2213 RepID=UPI002C5B8EBD|nr:hypothetical protein [Methanosarcina sp.]HOW16030.1 hypothetical protein [Methanosarcina sp.]